MESQLLPRIHGIDQPSEIDALANFFAMNLNAYINEDNVNSVVDEFGRTALVIAASEIVDIDMVRYLVEVLSADVNATGRPATAPSFFPPLYVCLKHFVSKTWDKCFNSFFILNQPGSDNNQILKEAIKVVLKWSGYKLLYISISGEEYNSLATEDDLRNIKEEWEEALGFYNRTRYIIYNIQPNDRFNITFNQFLSFIDYFRSSLKKRYEIVNYLLEKGADPNWRPPLETMVENAHNDDDCFQQPTLTMAILEYNFPLVKLLVEHGANKEGFDVTNDDLRRLLVQKYTSDSVLSIEFPIKPLDAVNDIDGKLSKIYYNSISSPLFSEIIKEKIIQYVRSLFIIDETGIY